MSEGAAQESDERAKAVVADHPEHARYEAHLDGALAGILSYADQEPAEGPVVRTLQHTVVGEAFGGKGVGASLAAFALQDAREAGRRIVPQCTFVQGWLERHPEHRDLVAD